MEKHWDVMKGGCVELVQEKKKKKSRQLRLPAELTKARRMVSPSAGVEATPVKMSQTEQKCVFISDHFNPNSVKACYFGCTG